MTEADSFPIHLAVHSLGVARTTQEGVATRSAFGAYVEALADRVDRLTVVAYDPPTDSRGTEDLTEFVTRPRRKNIDHLSLGPKGSWRDYPSRMRRVARIVREASPAWDVVLFRIVNRRANLVFRANQCPRVVTVVGGSVMDRFWASRAPWPRKMVALPPTVRREWHARRVMRGSGLLFANGERLVERYRTVSPDIKLLRSSVRRSVYSYLPPDRLDGQCVRLLVAGQIRDDKGVFEALEALERVKGRLLPGAELHVAGIGPDLTAFRNEVRRRGLEEAVVFHGWVPGGEEFFGLLRQMDVLLCLSHTESLPRVVWEALGHGVLVICTQVGSLPLAFTHERELMLVPVGSVEDVEVALARLVAEPALRKGLLNRGFERAQESTLEAVIDQMLLQVARRWPELGRHQRLPL